MKFDSYEALSTLREYVLINQDHMRAEVRHRTSANEAWRYTNTSLSSEPVVLPSLELTLPMSRVYRNWEPPTQRKL